MRDAILVGNIYCNKPNPEPDGHSGSQVRNGLGALALQGTLEYDLVNTIGDLTVNPTCDVKIGSSIFVIMS